MTQFSNDYIRIDDGGLDLLRNCYAYRHIAYSDIHSIRIRKGYLLRNRLVTLIIGIVFIAVSLKLMSPVLIMLSHMSGHSHIAGNARVFFIPLSFILLGAYFIFQSMLRSRIMSVKTDYGKFDIRIKEFDNSDSFDNLILFLNDNIKCRVDIGI